MKRLMKKTISHKMQRFYLYQCSHGEKNTICTRSATTTETSTTTDETTTAEKTTSPDEPTSTLAPCGTMDNSTKDYIFGFYSNLRKEKNSSEPKWNCELAKMATEAVKNCPDKMPVTSNGSGNLKRYQRHHHP
ncbi:hypothetical protein DICVIV_14080 [Dictyocaulus viviparus]|uniref:Uncharacterized protein n=1 Tax=Dictyocaulus viviparus TaxID=29172 RepID=A0A0D8X895_DICVI|nr:hypothetical protein DICVIV_14080 [Dictyocaulus viviparus]